MDTTHRDFYKGVDEVEMHDSQREHRWDGGDGYYYGRTLEDVTNRAQARPYSHPVRPISIDPEWVFGLETNLEGFSQADEHALPPNYKPFQVLFRQPGPITFKFRDEVFFNTRSGERFFMNRLWHNHPPLDVEQTYSVVPGYNPPIYIYNDMDRIAFNESTLKAIPWPGEEIDSMQPKLGERIVMGKYLSSYQQDSMTVEMAKAMLSKTELYKRQFEILTDVEEASRN